MFFNNASNIKRNKPSFFFIGSYSSAVFIYNDCETKFAKITLPQGFCVRYFAFLTFMDIEPRRGVKTEDLV